jgi:hypothetical protein
MAGDAMRAAMIGSARVVMTVLAHSSLNGAQF